jgi:hypothetical protein
LEWLIVWENNYLTSNSTAIIGCCGHSLERSVFYSPNTRNFTQNQYLILMQAGDLLSVAQVCHTLSKAVYLRQKGGFGII